MFKNLKKTALPVTMALCFSAGLSVAPSAVRADDNSSMQHRETAMRANMAK